MKILRVMQKRFLKSLTKLYKNTATEKVLELLNIIDIKKELEIIIESMKLDKTERKEYRKTEREKIIKKNYKYNYHPNFTNIIFDSKSRYTLWCLTDTGPFRSTLYKMKLVDSDCCRYCHYSIENFSHVMNDCEKFNESSPNTSTRNINISIQNTSTQNSLIQNASTQNSLNYSNVNNNIKFEKKCIFIIKTLLKDKNL
jgi:hypothetical protein